MTPDVVRVPRAIVVSRIYEPEGAAAAHRLGSLTRALKGRGFDVVVLTSTSPGARRSTQQVRRWPVLRDRSGAVVGYAQYASFDVPVFFRLLFTKRADVVVVEPPPTTGVVVRLASWIKQTPYIYFAADILTAAVEGTGASRLVVSCVRWLERRSLRGARGVLTTSDAVVKKVEQLGARGEQIALVGTGVDTQRFWHEGGAHSPQRPYLIYFGRMSDVHGPTVFLDAFEQFSRQRPEVQLRVFSALDLRGDIAQRLRDLGDRAVVSDLVTAEELAPWIRGAIASLASVRPGRGYDFAFATKALTSLSCGTPVIYAGAGPLSQLIAEHNLGWATPWEVNAVRAAMEQATTHSRLAPDPRLSEWVQEHYSLDAVASRSVDAIEGWLEDASTPKDLV